MDDLHVRILELEKEHPRYCGATDHAVRERFGMSAIAYFQTLNQLLDDPAAATAEPALINAERPERIDHGTHTHPHRRTGQYQRFGEAWQLESDCTDQAPQREDGARFRTGRTKEVARNALLEHLTELRDQITAGEVDGAMTLGAFADDWFKRWEESETRRARTIRVYRTGVRWIKEELGRLRLAECTTGHLEKGVQRLRKAAGEWEAAPIKSNRIFRREIADSIDVMLGTGVRIGGLLVIGWDDFDLDAKQPTVSVPGTVTLGANNDGMIFQPAPKSETSERTLYLPKIAVGALRRQEELREFRVEAQGSLPQRRDRGEIRTTIGLTSAK